MNREEINFFTNKFIIIYTSDYKIFIGDILQKNINDNYFVVESCFEYLNPKKLSNTFGFNKLITALANENFKDIKYWNSQLRKSFKYEDVEVNSCPSIIASYIHELIESKKGE